MRLAETTDASRPVPPAKPTALERVRDALTDGASSSVVWLITLVMFLAGIAIHRFALSGSPEPFMPPIKVSWWILALGFALSSVFVVHLPVRKDAHSVSLSEVLMVIGLASASPGVLIAGRLAGSAVALTLHRRQQPTKLLFNLTLAYLETTAALTAYRFFLNGGSPVSPRGWWAVVGAAAIAVVLSLGMVTLVIALHDQHRPTAQIVTSTLAGAVVSLGAAIIGLVYVLLIWADPRSLAVLIALTILLYAALKAFGRLAEQHIDLQAVFSFATGIHRPLLWDEVISTTLEEVRVALRADSADLIIFREERSDIADRVSMLGDAPVRHAEIDKAEARDVTRLLLANPTNRLFTPARGPAHLRARFAGLGFRTGIVTPVSGPDGVVAILAAGNRLGPVASFGADDLRLLEVLAKQTADTMARSKLVEKLRHESAERERQAADLVRSKDQFLASVSHELRTPLTGVQGCAELLVEQFDDMEPVEIQELVTHLSQQSKELSQLVDDLLVAARADIGSLTIKNVGMEVGPEIDRALASVSHVAGFDRVQVEVHEGTAFADPLRVRQVLRNLLTNALRYGGNDVQVRACEREGIWSIEVSDDGDGVPEDLARTIFRPYRSAHNLKGVTESVGLGLTVARQLAELMGGTLTYRRRLNRSVFDLRLAAVDLSCPDAAPTSEQSEAGMLRRALGTAYEFVSPLGGVPDAVDLTPHKDGAGLVPD